MLEDKLLSEGIYWSEFSWQICDVAEKYFGLDKISVEAYLEKNFYDNSGHKNLEYENKRRRLSRMLDAVTPHCLLYIDTTDPAIKKKAGQVFLSKLDYSQFGEESVREMHTRLEKLFFQIEKKGINPYKLIYCQVLTDGNLKRDKNSSRKYYDSSRDFENIYFAIKNKLKLDSQEVNAIFEKCSSLLAKSNAVKVRDVFECIRTFFYTTADYNCYRLFSEDETIDMLKINPSLLCASTQSIKNAYNYIWQKVSFALNNGYIPLEPYDENEKANFIINRKTIVRGWLKNNSSLLLLNSDSMIKKEKLIQKALDIKTLNASKIVDELFCDPITLSIIQQLPEEKIARNAWQNIQIIKNYIPEDKLAGYVEKNVLIFAFAQNDVVSLMHAITERDAQNPEENNMKKFLMAGKSLFAGSVEFKVEEILAKLQNNTLSEEIDVENMSGKECLAKFFEIFMPDDKTLQDKLLTLIQEKDERNKIGEKILRKNIRTIGGNIRTFGAILKDKQSSTAEKERRVCTLLGNLQTITMQRLKLSREETIGSANLAEMRASREIEEALNALREVFALKQEKMKRKIANVSELFDKTMDYLDECFDDKKAIPELYQEHIVEPYIEMLQDNFPSHESDQFSLLAKNIHVDISESNMRSKMKLLHKEIFTADYGNSNIYVTFEKDGK